MRDDTRCLPINRASRDGFDSLTEPVFRASTITFPTVAAYQQRRDQVYDGYSYGLYGTPTSRSLEMRISELEHAERTIVLPSGFAGIAVVTLACATSGQRVLFPDNCYDTVRPFALQFLAGLGIEAAFYDPAIAGDIDALLDDRVALVWVESPGSVTLEVQDVPAIAAAARARGIKVAADNAWATPLRFRPLDHGCDFSLYPLSKYLGGHSDLIMGSVAVRDRALYRQLKDVSRFLGMGVSADDASLALRGIETLAVRLDRSEANALALVQAARSHSSVTDVRYPALPTSPGHALWQRDFSGSSGVFTLLLDPRVRPHLAEAIERMSLFSIGASWGATRSIVAVLDAPPLRSIVPTPHDGPVVRLSVGLEHVDDLRDDLTQLLQRLDTSLGPTSGSSARSASL